MNVIDIDTRKPINEVLKPETDRLTREPSEHPDPAPKDRTGHPVTRLRVVKRRETVGAD